MSRWELAAGASKVVLFIATQLVSAQDPEVPPEKPATEATSTESSPTDPPASGDCVNEAHEVD